MKIFEVTEEMNVTPEQIALGIKNSCQPYLKAINYDVMKYKLYRGTNDWHIKKPVYIKDIRPNRNPSGSSRGLHELFIKNFELLGFKANRNNSVFCSGDEDVADGYGRVKIIYPLGNINYTWSPKIDDLYSFVDAHDSVLKYIQFKHKNITLQNLVEQADTPQVMINRLFGEIVTSDAFSEDYLKSIDVDVKYKSINNVDKFLDTTVENLFNNFNPIGVSNDKQMAFKNLFLFYFAHMLQRPDVFNKVAEIKDFYEFFIDNDYENSTNLAQAIETGYEIAINCDKMRVLYIEPKFHDVMMNEYSGMLRGK